MLEADSHLKLLPTSLLDIYKAFECIGMLPIDKQYQPYTVLPTVMGSDFGVLGHLWCDYAMLEAASHLKLLPPSILDIYKVFDYIDMLFIDIQ
jgi:hypothetical protein